MRNTNLTKLKSLGFLFWKPKERISEKTKKKDDLFLLNGNILVVIPHGTNNQIISSGYEDFFVSVSKAFDIKKGFFNQIKDLKEEKIKLTLLFGCQTSKITEDLDKKGVPSISCQSLEDIISSNENKRKFWTLIREFSSNNKLIDK